MTKKLLVLWIVNNQVLIISKSLTQTLVLLLLFFSSYSQITLIPDPNFEFALIEQGIDSDLTINGQILNSDASGITSLFLFNYGITNLAGISIFTDLVELNCSSNELTNIDVSSNLNLEYLQCGFNDLSTINLSSNLKLKTLFCSGNLLSTLNITLNTELVNLDFSLNQISSIDLSTQANLEKLLCNHNLISDLNIKSNPALKILNCSVNPLNSIDVSMNPNLEIMYCYVNQLSDLDVSANNELKELYCFVNQLISLDLSMNPNLVSLNCSGNQLTSLNVSQNPAIEQLYCFSNQLVELDVRNGNNTLLTEFNSSSNYNLVCIQVDDVNFANAHWDKDVFTVFTNSSVDSDMDGTCDDCDTDDDNDQVADLEDVCPGFDDHLDTNNNFIPDGCDCSSSVPAVSVSNNNQSQTAILSNIYGTNAIESNGRVRNQSYVGFTVVSYILLKPGFEVEPGASFTAHIVNCFSSITDPPLKNKEY